MKWQNLYQLKGVLPQRITIFFRIIIIIEAYLLVEYIHLNYISKKY